MKELTEQLRDLRVDGPVEPDMPEIYRRTRTRIVRRRRRATAVLGGVAGALAAVIAVGALAARPASRPAIADGPEPTPSVTESDFSATVAPTVPATALAGQVYIVQPGDTLSGIADAVYGDPLAFGFIASANGISESNPLRVGMELVIPSNPDGRTTVPTESVATYIVQDDDTLSTIATQLYGDPGCADLLAATNGISEASPLQVGKELVIPSIDGGCSADPNAPAADPIGADGTSSADGLPLYIVQAGDTWAGIAEAVYGDPACYQVIAEYNGLGESDPLRVGQELVIPPNPGDCQSPEEPTPQATSTYTPGG